MPFSIKNIAVYLPDGIVTNEELAVKFEGLKPDDVFKRTGVKARRRTTEDFIMSDMVFEAAELLFKENSEARQKIDTIILVGHGYDYKAPITAAILQHRLQISKNALTIDLPHGCTGYVNGLAVSKGLIDGGMSEHILLLTGDTPSFVIDKNNAELQSIFSDSGTASYISKNEVSDYEKFIFGTDGSGAESLMVRRSSSRNPADTDYLKNGGRLNGLMEMNGTEIFTFAIKVVPKLVQETLEKNNITLDELDYVVFHQANSFMLDILRRKIKIPKEKFFNDITETGNTVASTIPIALKSAYEKGFIKRGSTILLAGFGLGYTWGATVIKF
jgi:3-oxoacyl-[acyl-carrier-protein] synthase-3